MIDALIKCVSVTYECYEMYPHRGEKVQLLDQEMDAILLIIGIVYAVVDSRGGGGALGASLY